MDTVNFSAITCYIYVILFVAQYLYAVCENECCRFSCLKLHAFLPADLPSSF